MKRKIQIFIIVCFTMLFICRIETIYFKVGNSKIFENILCVSWIILLILHIKLLDQFYGLFKNKIFVCEHIKSKPHRFFSFLTWDFYRYDSVTNCLITRMLNISNTKPQKTIILSKSILNNKTISVNNISICINVLLIIAFHLCLINIRFCFY